MIDDWLIRAKALTAAAITPRYADLRSQQVILYERYNALLDERIKIGKQIQEIGRELVAEYQKWKREQHE